MIKKELLDILVCPETKEDLSLSEPGLIATLNEQIGKGKLKNRGGETIREKIDAGLIRADRKYLYPIRNDIPVMLIDEAIPLP